jgi:peroxiredoxin
MKRVSIIALSILVLIGCGQKDATEKEAGIMISGSITNPANGIVTIEEITADALIPIDTISVNEDNTFSHLYTGTPGYYRVNFYGAQSITVILDQDDINITADGGNQRGQYDITGSTDLDAMRKFNTDLTSAFQMQEQQLNQAFGEAKQAGNDALASEVQASYMKLMAEKQEYTVGAINMMGPSLATFQLVNSLDKDKHYDFINNMAVKLDAKYPNKYYIQDLLNKMAIVKLTAVGNEAPEISLPNPDGEVVKLSSLRGQVVLVDFWAEWCKPCRQENPNVVKAYNRFKDQGFTVYGVSLDRTKDKWLKAINDDGLTWTHVSDLKYFNSQAAADYGVQAIPFSLLVDRNGVIVAKNLRGAALDQQLETYFEEEQAM